MIRSTSTTGRSTAISSACARSSARSIRSSTPSKPSMASVTATARSERARRPRAATPPSRIGRQIIVLNLAGLAILVGGALLLNELRQGLVTARIQSLSTEGQLLANVIEKNATDPAPLLKVDVASDFLDSLSIPKTERVRLFDAEGDPISDSWVIADRVESTPLPPALKPGEKPFAFPGFEPKPPAAAAAAQGGVAAFPLPRGGSRSRTTPPPPSKR